MSRKRDLVVLVVAVNDVVQKTIPVEPEGQELLEFGIGAGVDAVSAGVESPPRVRVLSYPRDWAQIQGMMRQREPTQAATRLQLLREKLDAIIAR